MFFHCSVVHFGFHFTSANLKKALRKRFCQQSSVPSEAHGPNPAPPVTAQRAKMTGLHQARPERRIHAAAAREL
jgi:hypothetical protein